MPICHPWLAGPALAFSLVSEGPRVPQVHPTHPTGREVTHTALSHRPFGLAISRCGVVYVTRLDADSVTRMDLGGAVVASIGVGSIPTGIAFDRSGSWAYAANQADASVSIISVGEDRETRRLAVPGGTPKVILPGALGRTLYVADGERTVRVADTETGIIESAMAVPYYVNGLTLAAGDTLMYASATGGFGLEIDLRDGGRITRRIVVGGRPQEIIASSDGSVLYIANEAGWLDVHDVAAGRLVRRIPLRAGAFGMALTPDGRYLYVGLPAEGIVEIVDTTTLEIRQSVQVGGRPRRIAFSPNGETAVVANEAGWVSFIR